MAKKLPKTIAEKYIEGLRRRWPGLASAEAQDALRYQQLEASGADMPPFYYFLAVGAMSRSGVSVGEISRRLQNPEAGEATCEPTDVELDMLWAKSRHVFRCDKTLADELAQEGLPGKISVEVLRMLPYPVMFVEAPVFLEIVAVGIRVGPALGEARIAYVAQDDGTNLTGKKKAPHIRRGHLHCYVGRCKDGTRTYTVKRQPSMCVGFGEMGETVVHEAKCSSARSC